jgi:hypothetical protein
LSISCIIVIIIIIINSDDINNNRTVWILSALPGSEIVLYPVILWSSTLPVPPPSRPWWQ